MGSAHVKRGVFQCDDCGIDMEEKDIAQGQNLGDGPQYFCAKCKPAGSTEDAVEEMRIAMLSVDE